MFWRGASALPERFECYLDAVAAAVRWRRARPFALKELRTHLIEQREAYLAEGMSEAEAEEAALRDMGDPAEVGESLNSVHRPREQWLALAAVTLLACAAVFLRFRLTAGYAFERPSPIKTAAALLLGLGAMVGLCFFDYRLLLRHAKAVYAGAMALGLFSWQFGPHVNHAAWHTRHVVLLYPVVYVLWLAACRGKGWRGLVLAVLGGVPLAVIALMAPYVTGLFLLLTVGFAALLAAAKADWFGVGRAAGLGASLAAAAGVAVPAIWKMCNSASFARRAEFLLHPEQAPFGYGYQAMSVRNMLSGAAWQGETEISSPYGGMPYERIVPAWNDDYFLTTMACKLGWLFFLLAAASLLGLFLWLGCKALRERNACGRLMAFAAALSLLLQTVGAIAQNLGYLFFGSVSIPVFSGNLNMVITLSLVGLALSTIRQQSLPEEDPRRPAVPASVVQTS